MRVAFLVNSGLRWTALVSGSLLLAWLMEKAGMPAAFLLAPMIVAIGASLNGFHFHINKILVLLAQSITGCLVASYLTQKSVRFIWSHPVLMVLSVAGTFVAAMVCGLVLAKVTRLPREVALWGSMPGMAATVLAIAEEEDIDGRVVALVLYTRVLLVVALVSVLASVFGHGGPAHLQLLQEATFSSTAQWAILVPVIGISVLIGRTGVFPLATTLIPVVLISIIETMLGRRLLVPFYLVQAAFVVIGFQIGLRFTRDLIRKALTIVPMIIMSNTLLVIFSLGGAKLLSWLFGLDLVTATLAAVPGSFESVVGLALSNNADMSVVFALQTARIFCVVFIGPALVRWTIKNVTW
ncbi:MAG: AbrB family transcriptional regulator [Acetobacter sp.]